MTGCDAEIWYPGRQVLDSVAVFILDQREDRQARCAADHGPRRFHERISGAAAVVNMESEPTALVGQTQERVELIVRQGSNSRETTKVSAAPNKGQSSEQSRVLKFCACPQQR